MNEVPVFVLTGTDACALAALDAYKRKAAELGSPQAFIQDLEVNIIPDFRDFQAQEHEKVKVPD